MSHTENPAGTTLTRHQMNTIMPCEGNFSLTRIESERAGRTTEHLFNPPYSLRHGEAYAIYEARSGKIELWQVECVQRGTWRWVQEAKRAKSKWPATLMAVKGTPLT